MSLPGAVTLTMLVCKCVSSSNDFFKTGNIIYIVNIDVLGSTSLCISLVGGDPEFVASRNGDLKKS